MRTSIISLAVLAAVAALGGCGDNYTQPLYIPRELAPAPESFDNWWLASEFVLRKYYFEEDYSDRRTGVMTTVPLTGKHVFEFWRKDAVTWDDAYESTVQTIYRIATISIVKNKTGGYEPKVTVTVGRSDRTQQSVTTLAGAYGLANEGRSISIHRRRLRPNAGAAQEAIRESQRTNQPIQAAFPDWFCLLGEDELLADSIRMDIVEAAGKRSYIAGIGKDTSPQE
ncbi:MAG: hypothetical protein ABFD92_11575 [Planctomycetaceae bacterium]|nr:hypothetical protein [Planctomycetaceae bacterium]